jgi:hypothetical protein
MCECCTVRAILDRELYGKEDWKLLCLERIHILDLAHFWSAGTHVQYQPWLLSTPSTTSLAITESFGRGLFAALRWVSKSLYNGFRRLIASDNLGPRMENSSTSPLRPSGQFARPPPSSMPGGGLITSPTSHFDQQHRLIFQASRPTDGIGATLFAGGMCSRIGEDSKPSMPLVDAHVRFLMTDLDNRYRQARGRASRREIALAGLAMLCLWLGWLRSKECFLLRWQDFDLVEPAHGPTLGLPRNCGLVRLLLGPETKSSRTRTANVPIAYTTLSGYSIGLWFHRARHSCGLGTRWRSSRELVFQDADGTPWTSFFLRHTFLYPSLYQCQARGDPTLKVCTDVPGQTIEAKFWSLHCFRRGACSQVSRGGQRQLFRFRKATTVQIYEHARWHFRRLNERIDVRYRKWTLLERLQLTLFSM